MYNESAWTLTLATLGASKRAVSSAVSSPSAVIPGFAGTARFTFRVLSSGLAAVALLDARRRREPSNFERLSGRRNGGPWWRSDFGHHSFLCHRGPELELAAVLHGQGPHWLPPCGPTPASHPLRVAKRSPKTSFWVLLLAHDFLAGMRARWALASGAALLLLSARLGPAHGRPKVGAAFWL